MATTTIDPEKGIMSATIRPQTNLSGSPSPDNDEDLQGLTSLQIFQILVGIHTHPSITLEYSQGVSKSKRKARIDNVGLYQRAKQQERRSRIAYICTSIISHTLYMLQIILAATFTALSSYKDTNGMTLTILGAFNTVIAGCLAWQKGLGVPQRYRKAQDQYQALILEIEMAERSFLHSDHGGPRLDPQAEYTRLHKLFDVARDDQQANYPDLYVSTAAAAAKGSNDAGKNLEEVGAEAAKVQSDILSRIETVIGRLENKVFEHIEKPSKTAGLKEE